ncbi:MAG: hypothetical protein WBM40_07230 [Thiohalocapsa sp.]
MGTDDRASLYLLLPKNRVIRKRVAARTTAIHVCALARAPWAAEFLADADSDGYLRKHALPEAVEIRDLEGHRKVVSREEAWRRADARAIALEWTLLSGVTGRVAAFFSSHGQGVYANYGRPTVDFSGFFWDRITASSAASVAGAASRDSAVRNAAPAVSNVRVGPLFIAADTAAASGLTALGCLARGASLVNPVVASDIISTGAYEGTSAWATAKLGVFTGVKAMAVAASLPLAGASLATVMAGLTVGATTAIAAKYAANRLKDTGIDAAQKPKAGQVGRDLRWRHA